MENNFDTFAQILDILKLNSSLQKEINEQERISNLENNFEISLLKAINDMLLLMDGEDRNSDLTDTELIEIMNLSKDSIGTNTSSEYLLLVKEGVIDIRSIYINTNNILDNSLETNESVLDFSKFNNESKLGIFIPVDNNPNKKILPKVISDKQFGLKEKKKTESDLSDLFDIVDNEEDLDSSVLTDRDKTILTNNLNVSTKIANSGLNVVKLLPFDKTGGMEILSTNKFLNKIKDSSNLLKLIESKTRDLDKLRQSLNISDTMEKFYSLLTNLLDKAVSYINNFLDILAKNILAISSAIASMQNFVNSLVSEINNILSILSAIMCFLKKLLCLFSQIKNLLNGTVAKDALDSLKVSIDTTIKAISTMSDSTILGMQDIVNSALAPFGLSNSVCSGKSDSFSSYISGTISAELESLSDNYLQMAQEYIDISSDCSYNTPKMSWSMDLNIPKLFLSFSINDLIIPRC
jgi:hypothetical protein